jgi:hypothetical protein
MILVFNTMPKYLLREIFSYGYTYLHRFDRGTTLPIDLIINLYDTNCLNKRETQQEPYNLFNK